MEQMQISPETPFMIIEKLAEKSGVEEGHLLGWVKKQRFPRSSMAAIV